MKLNIGVGKYDITGPCAEIGFMGMSKLGQRGRGIHTRLFSRAYVIEDLTTGKHVVLVAADMAMCFQAIHQAVIKKLKQHPPTWKSKRKLPVNGYRFLPIKTSARSFIGSTGRLTLLLTLSGISQRIKNPVFIEFVITVIGNTNRNR